MAHLKWTAYAKGTGDTADVILDQIATIALSRINNVNFALVQSLYMTIFAHARLCRENYAHGMHRSYVVAADGEGVSVHATEPEQIASLNHAWNDVNATLTVLNDSTKNNDAAFLQATINDIDHGGGGGGAKVKKPKSAKKAKK